MSTQEMRGGKEERRRVIRAAGAVDGCGVRLEPAVIVVEGEEIIARGRPAEIGEVGDAEVVEARDRVVIPGLVNAHCHLDLTHIGPVGFEGDFAGWLKGVRAKRVVEGAEIRASVQRGVELSRKGGSVLVGDIAGGGTTDALDALRESGLGGVSYQEVFGVGRRQVQAIERLETILRGVRLLDCGVAAGVEPHAPYSCGIEVYETCARRGGMFATHFAESLEEIEFTERGTGFFADMLRAIGVWDETIKGAGKHPIDLLAGIMESGGNWLTAHVQYVEERHLEMLAKFRVTVAYCPRASEYFGHPVAETDESAEVRRWVGEGRHPYREMLRAGVRVALGTDSILCLGTEERISVFDEIRLLHQRDGMGVEELLEMATVAGAEALGFDAGLVKLRKGRTAGLLGVRVGGEWLGRPVEGFLKGEGELEWLHGPVEGRDDWLHQAMRKAVTQRFVEMNGDPVKVAKALLGQTLVPA